MRISKRNNAKKTQEPVSNKSQACNETAGELTKELADSLMKIPKEGRGMNLKNDADFILRKGGPKALEAVEKELERVGYPFKYSEIRAFTFYPIGLRALSLLAAQKVLGLEKQGIREMCSFTTYLSLIAKIKPGALDIKRVADLAPEIWRQYFTGGRLETIDYDLEKKYYLFRIWDFEGHPLFCPCMAGYFETLAKAVTKSKNLKCRETKCIYRGDDYDEFLITW